jgi:hypothetical protein
MEIMREFGILEESTHRNEQFSTMATVSLVRVYSFPHKLLRQEKKLAYFMLRITKVRYVVEC